MQYLLRYATMTLLRWYTSNTAAAPAQSCYDIQNDTETLQLLEHNIPLRVGPRRSPGFVVVPVLLVGSRVIVARPFSLFSTALHISLVKWIHAHGNGSKRVRTSGRSTRVATRGAGLPILSFVLYHAASCVVHRGRK